MAKTLQFRRGTTAELSSVTGAVGEIFIDTTKDTVVVMDGSTAGGFPLQRELVSNVNIKTVNGTSVLGSGDITISSDGLGSLSTVAKTGGDQITPTAIDLTKNVNKLTSGRYTLADGVEGQLMYIVPQHSSGAVDMLIEVANADLGIGAVINQDLVFKGDGTSQVITLIFTDGAWSQSGGEWIF